MKKRKPFRMWSYKILDCTTVVYRTGGPLCLIMTEFTVIFRVPELCGIKVATPTHKNPIGFAEGRACGLVCVYVCCHSLLYKRDNSLNFFLSPPPPYVPIQITRDSLARLNIDFYIVSSYISSPCVWGPVCHLNNGRLFMNS